MIYLVLSFDDASKYIVKCAKLLEKYNLKGTFYLDTARMLKELNAEDIRWISTWNEVGAHSVTHRDLTTLTYKELLFEVSNSKTIIEKIIEKPVESFAYPKGTFNKRVIEVVKHCGFKNARTTRPFNVSTAITNPYTVDVTFYTDSHAYRLLPKAIIKLRSTSLIIKPWIIKKWNKLIISFLESIEHEDNVYVHILTHPDFIEYRGEWKVLEDLFARISTLSNVTNLTMSEFVNRVWTA